MRAWRFQCRIAVQIYSPVSLLYARGTRILIPDWGRDATDHMILQLRSTTNVVGMVFPTTKLSKTLPRIYLQVQLRCPSAKSIGTPRGPVHWLRSHCLSYRMKSELSPAVAQPYSVVEGRKDILLVVGAPEQKRNDVRTTVRYINFIYLGHYIQKFELLV